jgi:hypothetical protein
MRLLIVGTERGTVLEEGKEERRANGKLLFSSLFLSFQIGSEKSEKVGLSTRSGVLGILRL